MWVAVAVVRDLRSRSRLETPAEFAAFEQDLLAEFVLARSSAGISDGTIRNDVAAVVELREWFGRCGRWSRTKPTAISGDITGMRRSGPSFVNRLRSRCTSSFWNYDTSLPSMPLPGSLSNAHLTKSTGLGPALMDG